MLFVENNRDFDVFCHIADTLKFSEAKAFAREHVAYYLCWHHHISNLGTSFDSVLYPAKGPDLSTSLLIFDPKKVDGVDFEGSDINELECRLKEGSRGPFLSSAAIDHRLCSGHWNIKHKDSKIGWTNHILTELVALDVDLDTVSIEKLHSRSFVMSFEWQHPISGNICVREFKFNHGVSFADWHRTTSAKEVYDALFTKGMNNSGVDSLNVSEARKRIKTGGLLGDSIVHEGSKQFFLNCTEHDDLAHNFIPLELEHQPSIVSRVQNVSGAYAYGYGWKFIPYVLSNRANSQLVA